MPRLGGGGDESRFLHFSARPNPARHLLEGGLLWKHETGYLAQVLKLWPASRNGWFGWFKPNFSQQVRWINKLCSIHTVKCCCCCCCCCCCEVTSVVSYSVRPHRLKPTRLPCPWASPGKNTGVGCHVLLQCMNVKSEIEVAHSCLTLSDPMDCSPPGSSIHGIFQARVLKWGAIAFSTTPSQRKKTKIYIF